MKTVEEYHDYLVQMDRMYRKQYEEYERNLYRPCTCEDIRPCLRCLDLVDSIAILIGLEKRL